MLFPILLDENIAVAPEYEFNASEAYAPFPRQYIIDQNGVVQYMAAQYAPELVYETIDALLAAESEGESP